MNLLKEGDFNITLVRTGNNDVDTIIDVYNSMIPSIEGGTTVGKRKKPFS